MMSMCLLMLRCWSSVRSRYLASETCVSVPSQNLHEMVNGDNLFDTVSATHFEELNCINQVSAHFSKRNKNTSCCSTLTSDMQSIFLYSRQSSANKRHTEFKHKGKLLINIVTDQSQNPVEHHSEFLLAQRYNHHIQLSVYDS